jgi:hypothetical protein
MLHTCLCLLIVLGRRAGICAFKGVLEAKQTYYRRQLWVQSPHSSRLIGSYDGSRAERQMTYC